MQREVTWNHLKEELSRTMDSVDYNTWISSLELIREDEHTMYLLAPSAFNREVILNSKRHIKLGEAYFQLSGMRKDFAVLADEDLEGLTIGSPSVPAFSSTRLNSNYIFEDFVVGSNNRFAHAASVAVAQMPGRSYNPLFIYGGVGLGKTHLMQAIGHYVRQKNPASKVLYVSSETFTNDFINSIQSGKNNSFRERYRSVDVLLIDDIQFIAKKEQTQEEFFHTFNELYNNNKQIVLTCDRSPKEMKSLEERLRSRFEWGLITDITPPDYETRIAILKKKAERDRKEIPDEVTEYIAKHIKNNIRELEGALTKVSSFASLVNQTVTLELCVEALRDLIDNSLPKIIDHNVIRQIICETYDLTEKELDSPKRTKKIAYPRQIAMYLVREMTDYSLPKIGEIFGNRDHSTVVHACDKITKEIQTRSDTKEMIENLKKRLIE